MADIFNEIEEEIRQDRSKAVWQKYGKYVIGFAVMIILLTVAHTGWREYEKSVRIDRSDRFMAAMSDRANNNQVAAASLFASLSENGGAGYGMLARFQSAILKTKTGDIEGAILVYDSLSKDSNVDDLYRGLALVMVVLLQMDEVDASVLLEKLAPQLSDNAPWRFSARELAASLSASNGDMEKAKEYLTLITDDLNAPQGLRTRASERLKVIGG